MWLRKAGQIPDRAPEADDQPAGALEKQTGIQMRAVRSPLLPLPLARQQPRRSSRMNLEKPRGVRRRLLSAGYQANDLAALLGDTGTGDTGRDTGTGYEMQK